MTQKDIVIEVDNFGQLLEFIGTAKTLLSRRSDISALLLFEGRMSEIRSLIEESFNLSFEAIEPEFKVSTRLVQRIADIINEIGR